MTSHSQLEAGEKLRDARLYEGTHSVGVGTLKNIKAAHAKLQDTTKFIFMGMYNSNANKIPM